LILDIERRKQIKIYREWAMPNKNTYLIKPIINLLLTEIQYGLWIDPFANDNTIRKIICNDTKFITNDLNKEYKTDYHLDALDFLKQFDDNSVDGVLYDPPFSVRQVSECYKQFGVEITQETTRSDWWTKHKKEISRIIKPKGKVISFGWNSGGIGKTNGFEVEKILLVPHGGIHNDTIVVVERRNK
jgi:hypothetical protein